VSNPTALRGLECGACGRAHDASIPQNLCRECRRPLLARYDLESAAGGLTREALAGRVRGMWRYREVLPAAGEPVTLGEGWTPLQPAPRLGARFGLSRLYIKDEALNPTGSFKARGLSAAVTMARERGAKRLVIPTAGNAGLALAAYAAAAGLPADVFCPTDTPLAFLRSMELLGARVHQVDGLIDDCGARVREGSEREGWFDLSTLKEPYRLEGKKTLGYELVEQLGGRLPDVILYPTGGGTGLVGMWKAFAEMEALGWIDARRPRMVSVQAEGCAPMVRAFHAGEETARRWEDARTVASGLRVPAAVGDFLILRALRESGGSAVAVSDAEMIDGARRLGHQEGILAAPEGGATVAALARLRDSGLLGSDETVVLFNTGTALSYLDAFGPVH
jgi:threonine synthase